MSRRPHAERSKPRRRTASPVEWPDRGIRRSDPARRADQGRRSGEAARRTGEARRADEGRSTDEGRRSDDAGRTAGARRTDDAAAAQHRPLPADLVADLVDAGSREHYADAALYDYEYRRRRADVTFYRELAKRRGATRILELGAGTGRVTIPLARDGRHVTAVDQSPAMLARLGDRIARLPEAAATRIATVGADLRTFTVGETFPLVIAAFNVLEHLYTRGEFAACMERVAAHLAPGGAFVFDVQLPDLAWLVRDPTKRWAKTRFTDPSTGRAMFYSTNHDYDPISQIVLIRLYYDPVDGVPPSRVVKLSQRKFFPAELEALVAHAGFRVVARYGDFSWRPLDGSAESQVLVCERSPAARRKPARPR